MKDYKDLPHSIQVMLEGYAQEDPYGLSPVTLYNNIVNSSGPAVELAKIFDVSIIAMGLTQDDAEELAYSILKESSQTHVEIFQSWTFEIV